MYYTILKTQILDLLLVGDEDGLTNIIFYNSNIEINEKWIENYKFFKNHIEQLNEFFSGKRKSFDLKLNPSGTTFQKKVWMELSKIPYGELRSYKDIAIKVDNPKGSRAIGNANNKNPLPIIVPCHRVIGKSGKLVGYAGGLDIKERLIDLELLTNLYNALFEEYKEQNWWPANTKFEMIIGAILVQNTNWINASKAILNMKEYLNPKALYELDTDIIADLIKTSGYFNMKAKKIKEVVTWLNSYKYNMDEIEKLDEVTLREELLNIYGIGKETADSILLYAFNKPSFVVDAYTHRIFTRFGFFVPKSYDEFKEKIENAIAKDIYLYNEFHALIVKHAKTYCLKTPKCKQCPLKNICKKIGVNNE